MIPDIAPIATRDVLAPYALAASTRRSIPFSKWVSRHIGRGRSIVPRERHSAYTRYKYTLSYTTARDPSLIVKRTVPLTDPRTPAHCSCAPYTHSHPPSSHPHSPPNTPSPKSYSGTSSGSQRAADPPPTDPPDACPERQDDYWTSTPQTSLQTQDASRPTRGYSRSARPTPDGPSMGRLRTGA